VHVLEVAAHRSDPEVLAWARSGLTVLASDGPLDNTMLTRVSLAARDGDSACTIACSKAKSKRRPRRLLCVPMRRRPLCDIRDPIDSVQRESRDHMLQCETAGAVYYRLDHGAKTVKHAVRYCGTHGELLKLSGR